MNLGRRIVAVAALGAALLAAAGCATGSPSSGSSASPDATDASTAMQADAAWLDDGRLLGVVTWGSSTCVPIADEATASGQAVSVTLTDPDGDQPCTADLAPRASVTGVPAGVDPHEDVALTVSYLDTTATVDLDGDDDLAGTPGDPTDYAASAGWFDDERGIVLLTWGSSTCPPMIEGVEESDEAITVTFTTNDGPCTMDMSPRATVIQVADGGDDRVLVLVGDNLDATIPIAG